jgi:hypothetical protein
MGRSPGWLNEKQIGVLRWVRDGCPVGVPADDYARRITARALHRRGLIAVRGSGPLWRATITDAGRSWLEAHPGPPVREAEVEQLIEQVMATHGPLVLPDDPEVLALHERLVRLSARSARRPSGWRLAISAIGPWTHPRHAIVLVRHFEDLVAETPVPVPARVPAYHPRVSSYLADKDWQLVSREHLARAARILQAIVDEADRRDMAVLTPEEGSRESDSWHGRAIGRSQVALRSAAGPYGVLIHELSAPGGKPVQPPGWNSRASRPRWLDARTTEFISTGVLELVIHGPGTSVNGDRHRDSKTITLEQRLPRLFRDIEVQCMYAQHRLEERRVEAATRRRRWEAAMAQARRTYEDQARWDHFQARAREWREITDSRVFLEAARRAAISVGGSDGEAVLAHLHRVEGLLDARDPLMHVSLLLPDVHEPGPDDLRPFLGGWDPRGPGPDAW